MPAAAYTASKDRYARKDGWFRRCGKSGLLLPAISLGCWHNFGGAGTDAAKHADEAAMHQSAQEMLFTAFDLGIAHFDLANNYGPPAGAAEERVGRILKQDFARYRDELIISSKAGYGMWPGPYGEWGSRKYLIASCEASLKRLQVEYVDIFYSHRPDPNTPWEETMSALDTLIRQGKTIYGGISSYSPEQTAGAVRACAEQGYYKPIIHQPSYSMFGRWIEDGLQTVLAEHGMGSIAFCPLAQGLLTGKYLNGIPEDSRAKQPSGFLKEDRITPAVVAQLKELDALARARGQTLAQMALAWVLRDRGTRTVTSALIGASRASQIEENVKAVDNLAFGKEELAKIDGILAR